LGTHTTGGEPVPRDVAVFREEGKLGILGMLVILKKLK
jgi:hypothetical protein